MTYEIIKKRFGYIVRVTFKDGSYTDTKFNHYPSKLDIALLLESLQEG